MPAAQRQFLEAIRRAYYQTGLTLRQLQDAAHVSDSTWSRYFNGTAFVPDDALRSLAHAARMPRADYLALLRLRDAADLAKETPNSEPHDSPLGYDLYDITYRLRGRIGVEVEAVQILRALTDDVDDVQISYWCGSDDDSAATFVLLEGGTLADDRMMGRPGFRTATVRFPATLRAGDTQRVRYDLRYSAVGKTDPDPDPGISLVIVRPTRRIVVRVNFDLTSLPQRVWCLDKILPTAGSEDPEESASLKPDATGSIEVAFDNPALGFGYGVAWTW